MACGLALLMPRRAWRCLLSSCWRWPRSCCRSLRPAQSCTEAAPTRTARGSNTQLVMSGTGPGEAVTGFIANPGNPPSTRSPTAIPRRQSDRGRRLHPQGRGLRRHHPRPADRRRRRGQPLLHRHPHRYVRRDRVRAWAPGTPPPSPTWATWPGCSTSTTPTPTSRPPRRATQPKGRRRAGRDLVLHRPLRAEHL